YCSSLVVVPLAATQSSPAIIEKSFEKSHVENEYYLLMREFWRKLLNTGNYGIMKSMYNGTKFEEVNTERILRAELRKLFGKMDKGRPQSIMTSCFVDFAVDLMTKSGRQESLSI